MHTIHLNLYSLYLASVSMFLLVAGIVTAIELYFSIFPGYVTSARDRWLEVCHRIVLLAAVGYCLIVTLHQLIGGDINAL